MSKISVGTDIIDITACALIRVEATRICFEPSLLTGACLTYSKGVELSAANFDTLSAWLLNQANNPHTVVIA